jgi:uncharacterized protein with ParB-like and HNH nuclease domain
MTLPELEHLITHSAFNKNRYEVSIPLKRFNESLMTYIYDGYDSSDLQSILKFGVPEFQRNNDKWSLDMQIKFVENILKGYVTTIQLYILEDDYKKENFNGCRILDGLQRTTALLSFIEGDFKVFYNSFSFDDLKNTSILKGLNKKVNLEIFRFDSQNDAIDFYVEMNENITHSKDDILKALSFKN